MPWNCILREKYLTGKLLVETPYATRAVFKIFELKREIVSLWRALLVGLKESETKKIFWCLYVGGHRLLQHKNMLHLKEGKKKKKQWEINQFSTIIFYSRSLVASNHFQLLIQSIRLYAFHCHILKSTDVGESDWSNRQNISDCSIQPVSQVDFFIWVRFCLNTGKHLRQRILGWAK